MHALLSNYWDRFLHPHKIHDSSLSFSEIVLISWIFGIINATYSVLFLKFSLLVNTFSLLKPVILSGKWYLYALILEALLLPLYFWFQKQIWFWVLTFFHTLFESQAQEREIHEVINNSFCAHILLVIPFLGKALHTLLQLVYIYLGLRNRLSMSKLQSFIIVISPLIFIALFFLCLMSVFIVFILMAKY